MLKKTHKLTGIFVSVFIAFHLFNHLMAWYGIETHQKLLDTFRIVYRNTYVEIILIVSFFFQAFSGIKLFLKLRKSKSQSIFVKVQMYSGLILGLYVIQHIFATIGQRLYFNFDTNFYFASRVVLQSPWKFFFVPYYFLGVLSVGVHLATAHKENIAAKIGHKKAILHFYVIIAFFTLLTCTILYVLMGGNYEIIIPKQYHVY